MVRWQRRDGECVRMRYGESLEPAQPHAFGYVQGRGFRKRKLSDRVLDCDFPGTRGRKVSLRRRVGEYLQEIVGEAAGFCLKPEPAVGVEKKFHIPSTRLPGPTRPGAASGVRLPPPFECSQQLLVQRLVEIVGNDEAAFVDSEDRAFVLYRYETCDGSSRAGDDDLLSGYCMSQQPGKMGLRFVDADLMHGNVNLD